MGKDPLTIWKSKFQQRPKGWPQKYLRLYLLTVITKLSINLVQSYIGKSEWNEAKADYCAQTGPFFPDSYPNWGNMGQFFADILLELDGIPRVLGTFGIFRSKNPIILSDKLIQFHSFDNSLKTKEVKILISQLITRGNSARLIYS